MSEIKYINNNLENVSLVKLHYQFIPAFINMDIWKFDMSLPNSPQAECAELLLRHGRNWEKLKHCRFAEDRRYRYRLGMKKWTEKAIKEHILGSRYDILMSINRRGFDKKLNKKQPVCALISPFWTTRFGYSEDWLKGAEIYHGGRRCAAMYALGYEQVPILWARDKYPGTNRGGKYSEKVIKYL